MCSHTVQLNLMADGNFQLNQYKKRQVEVTQHLSLWMGHGYHPIADRLATYLDSVAEDTEVWR